MKRMEAAAFTSENKSDLALVDIEIDEVTDSGGDACDQAPAVPEASVLPLGAELVVLIDPNLVYSSQAPNREESSYSGPEGATLLASIKARNGNEVPIEVNEVVQPDGSMLYELVTGERRVRCCREAGLLVRAIVKKRVSVLDDALKRLTENTGRKELNAYELGRQICYVLKTQPELKQKDVAKLLGFDAGHVSKVVELASLPPEVIRAFVEPGALRVDDRKPLKDAYKLQPQAVAEEAEKIRNERPIVPTAVAVERLVRAAAGGSGVASSEQRETDTPAKIKKPPRPIQSRSEDIGRWQILSTGALSVEITTPMSELQRQSLVDAMVLFVERKVLRLTGAKSEKEVVASDKRPSGEGLAPCKSGEESA